MAKYVVRRIFLMIPTMIVISLISFTIIQLPLGDFLTSYVATLRQQGEDLDTQAIQALEDQYGLNQPVYVQYWDYVGKKHTAHFQYSSPVWSFRSPANSGQLPYYATTHPGIFFARC